MDKQSAKKTQIDVEENIQLGHSATCGRMRISAIPQNAAPGAAIREVGRAEAPAWQSNDDVDRDTALLQEAHRLALSSK
jgi:hypothetical protein